METPKVPRKGPPRIDKDVHLHGLPKQVQKETVIAFVQHLLLKKTKDALQQWSGSLSLELVSVAVSHHRRCSSAVIHMSMNKTNSKKAVSALIRRMQKSSFQAFEQAESKKKDNTASTHILGEGEGKDTTGTSGRPAERRSEEEWRNARLLGQKFHKHLHEQNLLDQASDREATGLLFRAFCQTQQENNSSSRLFFLDPTRIHRWESLVMASMREQRLLRSKRIGTTDKVLVSFANLDSTFPTRTQQLEAMQVLLEKKHQDEENKHGVVVSASPSSDVDSVVVSVGETRAVPFTIVYLNDDDSPRTSCDNVVVALTKVVLAGAQRNDYKLTHHPELPAVLDKDNDVTLELLLTPKRIGVFRANLECHFSATAVIRTTDEEEEEEDANKITNFVISRHIMLKSSGDKEMDRLLQPQSPYKRIKPKLYARERPDKIFEAPNQTKKKKKKNNNKNKNERSDNNIGGNPFQKLLQYHVPVDIKAVLVNDEFHNLMMDQTWSPKEETSTTESVNGYGSYWKNLLWAHELQNTRDIQIFDLHNVPLQRHGSSLLSLHVAGLAEGRPSVLRGDLVHVTWRRNQRNQLFKGLVRETRLLDVMLEFHPSFHQQYNPSVDRVDVRFCFSRMTLRTSHAGCAAAAVKLGAPMLVPNPAHVKAIRSSNDDDDNNNNRRQCPSSWNWANRDLNEEQATAVENIVVGGMRPLPYIIFGPPGTGKTTTVVEAVYQLVTTAKLKVLLMAPSNDASDLLTLRLAQYFPPSELRRILAYSRSIETVSLQIRDYVREYSSPEAQLAEILCARIVVCTVNHAAKFAYFGVPINHFDVLCVDEAGHATEPEVVSVAASLLDVSSKTKNAGQLILAGDPKQLGPIITSDECRAFGLSVSYLERLMGREVYGRRVDDGDTYPSALLTKLVRNYRSHPSIIELPNKMFYDNELECCGDKLATHNMAQWEHLPTKGFPILFHSMDGENLREGTSPSWFNPQEAQQVVLYAKLLKESRPPIREEEIGIITPYARQAQKIRLALKSQGMINIKVGSVECFQGQERRCVIISTVRSQPEQVSSDLKYNLGFVANEKRFNVAITRAKTLLIVVGCAKVLAMDKENWLPFLKHCQGNKSWVGEDWEPLELCDEDTDKSLQQEEDDWELIAGPSQAAQQEGCAFISREE